MNTVITINLSGRAYQLEETGYNALRAYLDDAAKKLEGNPDKDEIIKDLERAVAEKCNAYLNPQKNVIARSDVDQIIKEMGPVEGTSETNTTSDSAKKDESAKDFKAPKKLFRIVEGEVIGGVCNGLAAYFNLDVTLVRVLFVILAIISSGFGVGIYVLMWIIVPPAITPEDKAQAFGTGSITAQHLVDRAKQGYNNFKNSDDWKKWKSQIKEQRKQWKYQRKYEQQQKYYQSYYNHSPFWEFMNMIGGLVWCIFIFFVIWFSYTHFYPVHQFFDSIGYAWTSFIHTHF